MPDAVPDLGAIQFLKARDVGGVLNATLAFLRRNAREVLLGFLAIVGPVALASGLSTALYLRQVGDLLADPVAMQDDPFGIFNVTYVGILLFGVLNGVVAQAAAGAYVRLYRQGEAGAISVGALWDETKDLILPMLGLTLAFAAAMVGSFLVLLIPCLGAIAWLAFLVWLVPYYAVTMAARATEADSLARAWERARVLVKGSWGFAFGAFFLALVVFYVIAMALSLPLSFVMFGAMVNSTGDPSAVMSLMGAISAPLQALTAVGYLIPLVAAYFVHGRLVEDLEGTSLHDDLDALADRSPATRWDAAPASTPPEASDRLGEAPPASTPPPSAERPEAGEEPPRGFRGGGFGGRA